jgi:hypothetical protein
VERDLPGGYLLIVELDPGIALGMPKVYPQQAFEDIWICPEDGDPWRGEHTTPYGVLDAATASEIIRDLRDVTR